MRDSQRALSVSNHCKVVEVGVRKIKTCQSAKKSGKAEGRRSDGPHIRQLGPMLVAQGPLPDTKKPSNVNHCPINIHI